MASNKKKKEKTSIPRNTFYIFVSQVVSKLISLVFVSIVARHLGTQGYGKLAFAFSFTYILTMFMDFGINTILIREIAREREKAREFIYNALVLKAFLSIFVLALIFLAVFLSRIPYPTSLLIYIIGFAVIITSTAEVFRSAYFTAVERLEFRGILDILHRLAELLLVVLFILLGGGLIPIALAILLASGLNFYLSWKWASRFLPNLAIKISPSLQKWIMKASLPIGVSIIFLGIYNRIDTVMLGFMKGDVSVALYNAAYRLMEVLV
ncbi:MAG: oligosaccharide flippase family protein, partial [Caldiserica bacterium]|nr:oligosaccharide flippase family protein [Caldisericota bacterium]